MFTETKNKGSASIKTYLLVFGVFLVLFALFLFVKNGVFKSQKNQELTSSREDSARPSVTLVPLEPDPITKITCEAKGGIWGEIGLKKTEVCNLPANDGGKECSNGKDCEGLCLANWSEKNQSDLEKNNEVLVKGKCSPRRIMVGCLYLVEGGKVQGRTCLD